MQDDLVIDRKKEGYRESLSSMMNDYLDNPPDCALWPETRQECKVCGKRGRFYCPDCLVFVGKPDRVEVRLELQLPLKVNPKS